MILDLLKTYFTGYPYVRLEMHVKNHVQKAFQISNKYIWQGDSQFEKGVETIVAFVVLLQHIEAKYIF